MIAVIYRWRVAPGKEERFRSGWRMATEAMYREYHFPPCLLDILDDHPRDVTS